MRKVLWIFWLLTGVTFAELDEWILELGAPELEVRNQAQLALIAEGEKRPRQTILRLARAYQSSEDLEIQSRLEELLTDMAREWMFYVPPGFLGINFQMVQFEENDVAAQVLQVLPGGAAEEAGLQSGDLILSIGGMDMDTLKDQISFVAYVSTLRPGATVDIRVSRGSKEFMSPLRLGERSVDQMDHTFFQQEEQKIQTWILGLRDAAPQDADRPMGHFRVLEE